MELKHESVMLEECIENLNIKEDGIYVDCTLGGAGHSYEICKRLSEKGTLIGIDQDDYALARAKERLENFSCTRLYARSNFSDIKHVLETLNIHKVNGILMDLGVSSFQLDDKERGFSYNSDARLDMRMDKRNPISAWEVVNEYPQEKIFKIIKNYGEEKFAKRIATLIVSKRKEKPIDTTFQLSEIIKSAIPAKFRREGPHPARRTFQAVRIEVNNELGILNDSIEDSVECLDNGGRIAIITFHSLEDRIVKQKYREMNDPCTCPPDFPICQCGKIPKIKIITKKPMYPSEEEINNNARSRSAKLRVAEKI
ncbi:16S rRNA (cytosine(1402)-N(4))-methyltransferase RsmH [Alkalibacter saccharofermentans]|uniref:Ribosomal RNA small subunit methyltransferase H n=1 Tax=Alkalibacter saccharofermentans DSM 14828 TaxID=1120975 RepID=A0A1M4UGY2_9FIRM|nr:16S rRNA (cytosine(1402)-N(4))-methyltransferase RsmH [Alkalibacter saccharofermentans]SHE55820.1 16S rRNA (cytosine1402-N4)-methyltransferase [Alkalibacter saccharofermentans DSM 14828]